MKQVIVLLMLLSLAACGTSKKEEPVMIKKVVCGDSVDQILYNEAGTEYTFRVPGKCDTILEKAPEN